MRRAWLPQLAVGMALIGVGWGSSIGQLEPVSRYWFQALWGGLILAADALVLRRAGGSLLRSTPPLRVAGLFALSAGFWWLYEVVNWHLRNWVYLGEAASGPVARPVLKTVAFATVLPALIEVRDLTRCLIRLPDPPALVRRPALAARLMLALGLAGGAAVWLFPRQAFALVWVAPFLVLDAVASLRGRPSALGLLAQGRAGPVLLLALSGLLTGVLWELWNWGADPHWEYRVPYVSFWKVFEMPLLGYGGYLPFALVADAIVRTVFGGRGALVDGPLTEVGASGRVPAGAPR
jgi:hypothetical protein